MPRLEQLKVPGFMVGINIETGEHDEPAYHIFMGGTDLTNLSKTGGGIVNYEMNALIAAARALGTTAEAIRARLGNGEIIEY